MSERTPFAFSVATIAAREKKGRNSTLFF